VTPERLKRVDSVLNRRQPDLTVLMDRVHKAHNFSAIIRSCDAAGVHTAHAIAAPEGLPIISHTAQGAECWVAAQLHDNADAAACWLKQAGFRLVAAHFSPRAIDFRAYDYTQPTAIVLGTELDGLGVELLAHCSDEVVVPMQGMTQSLNVSVACAVILYEAQRQRALAGCYDEPRLPPPEHARLRFEWLHPKVAEYCQKHRLTYPALNEAGDLVEALPQRAK
jgi:tRNA (guanosine-2'-O-)-methyltransferase